MDGYDGLSVHDNVGYKTCKFHGQEKRKVVERKNDKEMVNNYREWLLLQHHHSALTIPKHHHSALTIPNSLPLKMREVLVELSMVEKEINRLESQIKAVEAEAEAQHSKQARIQSNSDRWQHRESSSNDQKAPSFETKGLHFISKAIRGDYKLSDFRTNHKAMNSTTLSNHKEKRATFREKVTKQRPQTPGRNCALEIPHDSRKATSTPLRYDEDHKWPPNKLSENIMNCLIFIFVRILRTSKSTELEKSTRSANFSLSFRAQAIPNPKSRPQDPYGIFDSKESVTRDIGPYKNLIRFTASSMDFNCIQNSGFLPLFQKLKILIDGLQKVDLRFLSHQQKLAFWINMHNACIMHGYLQFGLPSFSSPEKMLTLIKQATLNIGGNSINAQTIERFILRKASDSVDKQIFHTKEMTIQQLYGLKTPDPNITFALCCGTRSSPSVKIYTAEGVTSELQRSKLEYLEAAIMVKNRKRIALPELLLKSMHDFGQDICSLMEWLCHQLPASSSLRKSIVECFRGLLHGGKMSTAVEMIPYDYEFQYLFAI